MNLVFPSYDFFNKQYLLSNNKKPIKTENMKILFFYCFNKNVISWLFIGKHSVGKLITFFDITPVDIANIAKTNRYFDLVFARRFFILNFTDWTTFWIKAKNNYSQ